MSIRRLIRTRYVVGWCFAFIVTLIMGALVSVLDPTGIRIELLGAFMGVFAAVAFGGVLTSYSDYSDAKQLIMNLNNELDLFSKIVNGDGFVHVHPQFWELGKSTGRLSFLDNGLSPYLLVLYHSIL